jgi:L-ascorbate metabolism protein UlaG (beta-lactamase superfamily)
LLYEDGTRFGSAVGGRCNQTVRALCAPIVRCAARRGITYAVERGQQMLAHALRRGRLADLYARPGVLKPAFLFPPPTAVVPKALLVQGGSVRAHAIPLTVPLACDLAAWVGEWQAGGRAPRSPVARSLYQALVDIGMLAARPRRALPRLGHATLVGHATVRLATAATSLLFDPFLPPPDGSGARSYQPLTVDQIGPPSAVFITHSHPDHFDLGTLLRLGADTPIYVPAVGRESVLAVDMLRRLREVGFRRITALGWFEEARVGDFRVIALPFYGEQPTTHEVLHPEVRNQGNTYVVEGSGRRYALTGDGGCDHAGDLKSLAFQARRRFGLADVVFGGFRGFAVYPVHYLFSSVAAFLPFVPPSMWGVRQKIMDDAADLLDVAEIWGAAHVIPYAAGGAPWYWNRGLGPRLDLPASSPGQREVNPRPEHVLAVARRRSTSRRDGDIRSPVEVKLLRPGDSLVFGARGRPRLRRVPPHAWPYGNGSDLAPDVDEVVRWDDNRRVLRKKVLLRLLAEREAERLGIKIPVEEAQAMADAVRRRLVLASAASTRRWLSAQGLTEAQFTDTMRGLAAIGVIERHYGAPIQRALPAHLAIAGTEGRVRTGHRRAER